jgi:Zn-dependent protease with chaperone function|tara:strand:- start:495 stop:1136 length:642 start_codon:yes stop_codon:yes gene_type:complete
MKFVQRPLGEATEVNSGGGIGSKIREIATLGGLALLTLLGLFFVVSWITDAVVYRLSPQREAKLFAFYGDTFTGDIQVPEALEAKWSKAHELLDELVAASDLGEINFKLGYLASEEPNALAVPGGSIVLTQGLLKGVESDIGLAFVLEHSREREAAADAYAIALLEKTYETTEGAGELFRLLEETNDLPGWAYMFATHPDNLERLKKLAKDTQ